MLKESPGSVILDLSLYIPIFDANPEYISLSITESGSFSLSSSVQCSSVQLSLSVSPSIDISLSTEISVSLRNQPQPIVFDVSAAWQQQASVSFSGQMTGGWNNPFGAKWLAINSASVSLVVGVAQIQSLSFAGAATLTFNNEAVDTSFSLTTSNNFVDTTFMATVDAKWTLTEVAKSVLGTDVTMLSDVHQDNEVSVTVIVSTAAQGTVKSGLTIQTKGNSFPLLFRTLRAIPEPSILTMLHCSRSTGQISGSLLKTVHALNPAKMGGLDFDIGMTIPVFTNPLAVSVALEIDYEMQITDRFYYEACIYQSFF